MIELPVEQAAADGWMTTGQAALKLGLSAQRVRQLVESGKLVAQRTVLGRLIDPASVETLAKERAK
jgi:excisionase family DNA binding protein